MRHSQIMRRSKDWYR